MDQALPYSTNHQAFQPSNNPHSLGVKRSFSGGRYKQYPTRSPFPTDLPASDSRYTSATAFPSPHISQDHLEHIIALSQYSDEDINKLLQAYSHLNALMIGGFDVRLLSSWLQLARKWPGAGSKDSGYASLNSFTSSYAESIGPRLDNFIIQTAQQPTHMETGIQTDSKPLITIPARTENNYLSPTFLSAPRSSSKQQDARESPAPVPANAPFRESSINSPAGHILSPRHTLPHTTPPKEKHFFCTHCRDDFLTEVYLKKHEVTFHGNILKWQCPHCQRDFPSLTQLKRHHNKCHHGTTTTSAKDGCNDNCQLPAAGKLSGPKKIAFACGYCVTLFDNFEKYLDHIVHHYQSTVKKTREDWSLTRVIATLLEQPGLHEAWRSFMAKKHGPIESWPSLSWELENSIDGTRLLTDLEMGINENDKTFQTAYELATKSWSQVPVTGLDLSGTISPQTICEAGSSGQGPKDSLIFLEENDILDYYNDYEPPNLDEHPAQGEHPKQSLTQENLNQWYGDNFHNAMNQFHQREEFLELNPPHTLITTQLDKVPHQHATPNFSNPPDIPLPLPPKRSKVDMTF